MTELDDEYPHKYGPYKLELALARECLTEIHDLWLKNRGVIYSPNPMYCISAWNDFNTLMEGYFND